jgi:nitroreductase
MTHGERLEQLRRALEAARTAPTAANLRAVAVAFETVEFSDELDEDDLIARRNEARERECESLGRELARQLGLSAPTWLRRHLLGEDLAGADGPPHDAIVYECPVCGAQVESAPGLRAQCSDGHAPAYLVAVVPDEE